MTRPRASETDTSAAAATLPPVFWRQWSASAASNLGDGITFVAMPLLAYSLTDDERLLSLTAFAVLLPWLVLALPVGVLVDRVERRSLLAGASMVRTTIFALVALAASLEWISIWMILIALLVIGSCEVAFDSAAQAFLPELVDGPHLPRANGYLLAAEIVLGGIIGLSIGALLFSVGPALPFGVNAAAFAVAAVLVMSIRVVRRTDAERHSTSDAPSNGRVHVRTDIAQGLRWLWSDSLLRTLALLLAVASFGMTLGQGIFVKYAAVELGVTGAAYGLLLLVTSLGAAVGGLLGHRVQRRLGIAVGIVAPYVVFGLGQLMFAAFPVAWVVAATGFAVSFAITTWNVVTVSLRQVLIPTARFGRINSVYRWLGTGASAVGAVVGGQIAYHTSMRTMYLVAGVITLAALLAGGRRVVTAVRDLPASSRQAFEPATPAPPSMT